MNHNIRLELPEKFSACLPSTGFAGRNNSLCVGLAAEFS
jgi:hypothetical protein